MNLPYDLRHAIFVPHSYCRRSAVTGVCIDSHNCWVVHHLCENGSRFCQRSVSFSRRHRMSQHYIGIEDSCRSTTKPSVMPFRTPSQFQVYTVAVSLSELVLHHISLFCLDSNAIDLLTLKPLQKPHDIWRMDNPQPPLLLSHAL